MAMKLNNRNETSLIEIINDICDKLNKTIFSSFKMVAIQEIDSYLRQAIKTKAQLRVQMCLSF